MHMVFSTECDHYFDWQSLGMMHSFITSGQKGKLTRLMACDKKDWPGTKIVQGDRMDTHIHKNWVHNPNNGDHYPAYNKPASIIDFMNNYPNITAEYIIFLDADMIIRNPVTIEHVGAKRGQPVAAYYGYLVGIFKENYMKIKSHIKNLDMAQQVGGFVVMHVDDLRKVAPLWLKYTEEVRTDSGNWGNTGDIFNNNGKSGPPWISEMYGYVYAAADAGVKHIVSSKFMLYPGYMPPHPDPWPLILHYGITYNIDEYAFDKHWHRSADFTTCPGVFPTPSLGARSAGAEMTWLLGEAAGRLFEKPMRKEQLPDAPRSPTRHRKEVALDAAWGLYEATKWWKETACGHAPIKASRLFFSLYACLSGGEPLDAEVPDYTRYSCKTGSNGVNHCRPFNDKELKTIPRGS
eukprot:gene22997-27819_t